MSPAIDLEIVVAGGDSIRVWELCSAGYPLSNRWWPMLRHDRARTGCYGFDVPTGVYFCRLDAAGGTETRKLVLGR